MVLSWWQERREREQQEVESAKDLADDDDFDGFDWAVAAAAGAVVVATGHADTDITYYYRSLLYCVCDTLSVETRIYK